MRYVIISLLVTLTVTVQAQRRLHGQQGFQATVDKVDGFKTNSLQAGATFSQFTKTVHVSGMKFAKNVTLRDFTLDYDRKTHSITTKAIDDRLEKKKPENNTQKPVKRKLISL